MKLCKKCGGKCVIVEEGTPLLPPMYTPMCETCSEIVLPFYDSKEEAIRAWDKDWGRMYEV